MAAGSSCAAHGNSPRSLFVNGEQGAWFDASDMSTMYQDSAGTTPVTAVGQPVGLMLDKRLGAVRGAVVNTTTSVNGVAIGGPLTTAYSIGGSITINEVYEIQFTVSDYAGTGTLGFGSSSFASANVSANGTYRYILPAVSTRVPALFTRDTNTANFSNISIRPLPGNHRTQATAASRPTLRQDASGYYYLEYDGIDDSMATGSVDFSGMDKMTVFAGINKASDAASGVVVELTTTSSATAGSFGLFAPVTAAANYQYRSGGTIPAVGAQSPASYAAPISNVLTGQSDIAGDSVTLRVNGSQVASSAGDQGTGNFANSVLYFGRRGGSTLPFNGREYQTIIRGAATDATTIQRAERFVGSRMGISL
jgi:hypothetical protein